MLRQLPLGASALRSFANALVFLADVCVSAAFCLALSCYSPVLLIISILCVESHGRDSTKVNYISFYKIAFRFLIKLYYPGEMNYEINSLRSVLICTLRIVPRCNNCFSYKVTFSMSKVNCSVFSFIETKSLNIDSFTNEN